ncbi:diguanylate cyclase/phosphodiesterase with PAS/PAC sensor [Alteracholeplasma palmae J233]|uniref:Diguanylate cyclase/phosphodiesterase with PAS/PAC sensor n=1 Tax=Alteracholeplasma palmae (strain ATCC 49389 / J233) TaxID=1318466 RepID=U4KJK7_ALTPJ|nr:PAS domain-containing protein [Alteracholeplasma palmae]CCV63684.1 diguanylate cyclase/phosphodiesterase with PAS/PAC sensor [Alteracholeplasma palmae J233]
MLYPQHPVFVLAISIILVIMVILNSIQKEKIQKNGLALSLFNIAVIVLVFISFEAIKKDDILTQIYFYYTVLLYIIFLFAIYITLKNNIVRTNQYQLFVKSIKNSRWNAYYAVDKKERIKDISSSLLQELGLEKEDVIGKKLFQIFNKSIRFTKLNDTEINNRTLETYYKEYKKRATKEDEELQELYFLNYNGEAVVLKMVMQPIFLMNTYKGRICVGEKKTDFDLFTVEKELNQSTAELESIQQKFIATLELSEEGLFYLDLNDKSMWLNDTLKEVLKLTTNTISLDDYRKRIEPEDLKKYLMVLSELTPNKDSYKLTYRYLVEGRYIWIQEKGKRLFEDLKTSTVMGIVNPIRTTHFRKTNIDILDEIKDEHDLLVDMNQLIQKGKVFQLAIFKLQNIPNINDKYSREIGNMMIGSYLQKLSQTFITESSGLYRISGLEFALTITDPRKMDTLYRGINERERFLNLTMEYGSVKEELEVFVGVSIYQTDAHTENEMAQYAYEALKVATNPQFNSNGCYYKDVK